MMTTVPSRSVLAIFAHPDDIEFFAAGTLLMLQAKGWSIHYFDLCTGHGGSVQMDGPTTAATRLHEAQQAAQLLGAKFYPPISDDLDLTYNPSTLRKVAAVVRQVKPSIVLTHAPQDYMEDHMNCSRLAVTASFAHCIPNYVTDPPREAFLHDVTVYHAMPHGLCDPLRQKLQAGLYVNTSTVHQRVRAALAAHASQKHWLDISQGADSYLVTLDHMAMAVGQLSGQFEYAEGWRRHLHLGFSSRDIDPLRDSLGEDCLVNQAYENALAQPR